MLTDVRSIPVAAAEQAILSDLSRRFGSQTFTPQKTIDDIPTFWVDRETAHKVLSYLRSGAERPFRMLYDLTAVDERTRVHRKDLPDAHFTVIYHLMSFDRNDDIRIKVPLRDDALELRMAADIWPNANWYEREVWDLFGIRFAGHPQLRRILTPPTWTGHPLRKDHVARATEMAPYVLTEEREIAEQEALRFRPEEWGMKRHSETADFMFLNLGPNHPSVHGVFRIILQLEGEEIVDAVPEIGFHHRGAEKMAERQTWHTYIPYTDRIDYLGGVMNNFPYVMAVEKLAGITVPPRAQMIRIMLAELFRMASHLVFYGTMSQDVGQLSPVFYMFADRERVFHIIEAIRGFRMHPAWFRIGGVAADLPQCWDRMIRDYLDYQPKRLDEYQSSSCEIASSRHAPSASAPIPWTRRSIGVTRVPACAPAASPGTTASSAPIRVTISSISTSPQAAMATATIAWSSISRRCGKASASSANASTICRPVSTDPSTGSRRRRSESGRCMTSRA
jgi:NADH-quinone oxidoreductase subunit C/D